MTVPDLDDLTARVPGQALMVRCLALQGTAPVRGRFARVFGAHALVPEARSWFDGAKGEQITARLLDALGPEYVVLHSVPVRATGTDMDHTDIDHVVVGPMGVVTVDAKHHRDARVWVAGDAVRVDGRPEQYVHAARSERRRVQLMLGALTLPMTPVTTVVAVLDPARLTIREAPGDVEVVEARRLVRIIARMPVVLGHDAVWAVAGALASSATWTDEPTPDDSGVVRRFAALDRQVRAARAARLAWAAGACAGVAGGLVGIAAAMPALLAALG